MQYLQFCIFIHFRIKKLTAMKFVWRCQQENQALPRPFPTFRLEHVFSEFREFPKYFCNIDSLIDYTYLFVVLAGSDAERAVEQIQWNSMR